MKKKNTTRAIFHLAFPVHNLRAAKTFYLALGCKVGRASKHSVIFNLEGNQIVAQLTKGIPPRQKGIYPRHFGLVFGELTEWEKLLRRAERSKLKFYQAPRIRYPGTPLEHRTFFLEDPSRNLLEFKHYSKADAIFGKAQFRKVGDKR